MPTLLVCYITQPYPLTLLEAPLKVSTLLVFALFPLFSYASPLVVHYESVAKLIKMAEADVVFISENADKCTRNDERLRREFLKPLQAELVLHRENLARGFDLFAPSSPDCTKPARSEFAQAKEISAKTVAAILLREQQARAPQGKFFGMTGDRVMDMALGADSSYPKCVEEEPGNTKSTRPLKTYYRMKDKFLAIKRAVRVLEVEAEQNLKGSGHPVCRK